MARLVPVLPLVSTGLLGRSGCWALPLLCDSSPGIRFPAHGTRSLTSQVIPSLTRLDLWRLCSPVLAGLPLARDDPDRCARVWHRMRVFVPWRTLLSGELMVSVKTSSRSSRWGRCHPMGALLMRRPPTSVVVTLVIRLGLALVRYRTGADPSLVSPTWSRVTLRYSCKSSTLFRCGQWAMRLPQISCYGVWFQS